MSPGAWWGLPTWTRWGKQHFSRSASFISKLKIIPKAFFHLEVRVLQGHLTQTKGLQGHQEDSLPLKTFPACLLMVNSPYPGASVSPPALRERIAKEKDLVTSICFKNEGTDLTAGLSWENDYQTMAKPHIKKVL